MARRKPHGLGACASHPFIKWTIGIVTFIAAAEILVGYMPPAWAAASIHVTDRIVIELGDIPQWIIAFVAAAGLYKAWRAEVSATLAVKKIEEVRHETNSMRAALEAEAKASGKQERNDELAAEKALVRSDSVADAEAAAKVRVADSSIIKQKG